MDIQKERAAFVEKYRKVYKVDKSLFVNDSGEFTDLFCQDAWLMWQAAQAQAVSENTTEKLESTANFTRGMCFDPRLHHEIKEAITERVAEIDGFIEAQEQK